MDIKTSNIVLDTQNNARLIDFGLARELAEGDRTRLLTASVAQGTHGYFPVNHYDALTIYHDYHNFGVGKHFFLSLFYCS